MSEVTSGIFQGCNWKPKRSNSFITELRTRTWSKLKAFVSNMKWQRVTDAEEDRSVI